MLPETPQPPPAVGLAQAFAAARDERRAALVVYATAGFPAPEQGDAALAALAEAGADVIELGVPFSDPLADGPTIQAASHRAIAQGVDLEWTLAALRRFRARHATPVVVFSYLNPVLGYGLQRFIADATAAGAQGVLLTDLPVGADPEMEAAFAASPLDLVRLVAPTTTPARARAIAQRSAGFVYYISRTGVTGAQAEVAAGVGERVAALRAVSPVPVAVGFGIANAEQAARVAGLADGVVVGSAVVDALARGGVAAARALVASLRAAMAQP